MSVAGFSVVLRFTPTDPQAPVLEGDDREVLHEAQGFAESFAGVLSAAGLFRVTVAGVELIPGEVTP